MTDIKGQVGGQVDFRDTFDAFNVYVHKDICISSSDRRIEGNEAFAPSAQLGHFSSLSIEIPRG